MRYWEKPKDWTFGGQRWLIKISISGDWLWGRETKEGYMTQYFSIHKITRPGLTDKTPDLNAYCVIILPLSIIVGFG